MSTEYMKVSVSDKYLGDVLRALTGPSLHIAELQVTRNIVKLTGSVNPIDALIDEFNAYVVAKRGKTFAWVVVGFNDFRSMYHRPISLIEAGLPWGGIPVFGLESVAVAEAQSRATSSGGPILVAQINLHGLEWEENSDHSICVKGGTIGPENAELDGIVVVRSR